MDVAFAAGLGATLLGLVGYVAGLSVPYPGRAFSVTALMIGVTLLAIGSRGGGTPSTVSAGATDATPTDRTDATPTDRTHTASTDRPNTGASDGGRR